MNQVVVDTQLFATLVGHYLSDDAALFKVSPLMLDELREWSKPVRLRVIEQGDGLYEIQLQRIDGINYVSQDAP